MKKRKVVISVSLDIDLVGILDSRIQGSSHTVNDALRIFLNVPDPQFSDLLNLEDEKRKLEVYMKKIEQKMEDVRTKDNEYETKHGSPRFIHIGDGPK